MTGSLTAFLCYRHNHKKSRNFKRRSGLHEPIGYQLFRQIFIDACGSLAAFTHGYLSLPRQNPSFAFAKLARQGNFFRYLLKYSLIEAAAFLPSPMAKITVAAPRTISPPAQTFVMLVACFSSTVM